MNIRLTLSTLALTMCGAWAFSQVTLFVASDTGRNGYYQQKPIAELMGEMAEHDSPEAILALGDITHYQGVQSTTDPLWMTNYELVYSHPELQAPWYAICGNHEYRGNTQAVLDYSNVSRRWNMPARYYAKTFSDGDITVKVIFLDTTPLIGKYRTDTVTTPDASRQDVQTQLDWFRCQLNSATQDWVVVVGHHPVYAQTPKDDSERLDMQRLVAPLLDAGKADMYVCGHIHNFQHLRPQGSSVDYVVNSSGSLAREKVEAVDGTVFAAGVPGFSRITATKDSMKLDMIGPDGKVIHTVARGKRKH